MLRYKLWTNKIIVLNQNQSFFIIILHPKFYSQDEKSSGPELPINKA